MEVDGPRLIWAYFRNFFSMRSPFALVMYERDEIWKKESPIVNRPSIAGSEVHTMDSVHQHDVMFPGSGWGPCCFHYCAPINADQKCSYIDEPIIRNIIDGTGGLKDQTFGRSNQMGRSQQSDGSNSN